MENKDADVFQFTALFSDEEDGLIMIVAPKGELIYKLKELAELYAPEESKDVEINWDDDKYLSFLYAIEGAIKRVYDDNPELTDASVILALERLSVKSEIKSNDPIIKEINQQLRLKMSFDDYTRYEVRWAIRKILASVKRRFSK